MPDLRDKIEARRFKRLVAEARRRYGGPSRYAMPLTSRPPQHEDADEEPRLATKRDEPRE